MENEENISFDVEHPEEQVVLTLDEKFQNTFKLINSDLEAYQKVKIAKSFVENCLVPEELNDSDAETYIKYKIAKEFGLKNTAITDLKNTYKDAVIARKNEKKANVQKPVQKVQKAAQSDIINDIIMKWEDYVYPDDYSAKDGKIVKTVDQMDMKTGDCETTDKDVSLTPFILCGKSAGEKKYYTIRYAINDSYNEFIVPMEDLLDNNTMQRILTSHGINVPASLKFEVNDYIGAFIHQLGNNLKAVSVTSQNGWNEDFTMFAVGNNGITKAGIVPIISTVDTEKHIAPFCQKGNQECWIKGVTPVLNNPKPRFLFYHGMSSALIKILQVEQDIIDITGDTSTGKTGTNAVVTSAIANPSCKPDGYALEVGDSFNPLIAHAAGLRDMPVVFEEATGEERRKAVIKAAYNIANGVDKTRSQKNGKVRNDVLEIRSNVLISCEQPISEEVKTAGGRQRVKDLNNVLPRTEENGKMINETKKIIFNNYGFFFPNYIQKIMSDIPRVKELYDYALTKITKNYGNIPQECTATIERSRNIFAAKLVAGYLCEEIFTEIGIPAKTKEETEKLVNDMFQECVLNKPVELDFVKAIRVVLSWRATTDEFVKTGEINYSKDKSGEETATELKIVGSKFTAKMKSEGLPANVLSDLYKKGIADSDEVRSIRVNGKTCSAIQLNINKMINILLDYENKDNLALFEKDEETGNEIKPTIKNPDPNIEMRYKKIIKYIRFMQEDMDIKSVDSISLELALKFEVQQYLDILIKQSKIKKTPTGEYYI